MYKAKFDFCKKRIKGEYNITQKDVIANFNLELKPDLNKYATKEDLDRVSGTYTHEQAIASDVWVIHHNLGKRPSITIVDSADNVVEGAEKYIDDNIIELRFNGAFKGKAYLN